MADEDELRWEVAGPLTAIEADVEAALAGLPHDPIELCRAAQGLVMLPDLAPAFGLPDDRQEERAIRSASAVLRRALELDPAPVGAARAAPHRVIGTCRHFALLSCAFLRHRSIPARARCGFASYFEPELHVDHWITEYRADDGRWIRIDPEILGFDLVEHPEDLAPGAFLTGGEAWTLIRRGAADPETFGVAGTDHAWGIAEVRGNAIRDLASLNKVEALPWDEWGGMPSSYEGTSGPSFDALIDDVAAACASADPDVVRALYESDDLRVPHTLLGS